MSVLRLTKGGVSRSIDFRKWACRARFVDHRLLDSYIYVQPTRVFLFTRKGPLPLLCPASRRSRTRKLVKRFMHTRFAVFYYETKGWPLGKWIPIFFLARNVLFFSSFFLPSLKLIIIVCGILLSRFSFSIILVRLYFLRSNKESIFEGNI